MPLQLFDGPHLQHFAYMPSPSTASSSTSESLDIAVPKTRASSSSSLVAAAATTIGSYQPAASLNNLLNITKKASKCPIRQLFPMVTGLRWGTYVGSPNYEEHVFAAPSLTFNFSSGHRCYWKKYIIFVFLI